MNENGTTPPRKRPCMKCGGRARDERGVCPLLAERLAAYLRKHAPRLRMV